jgi:hypothetical protein
MLPNLTSSSLVLSRFKIPVRPPRNMVDTKGLAATTTLCDRKGCDVQSLIDVLVDESIKIEKLWYYKQGENSS